MPLKRCSCNGVSGWKWGDRGTCYCGPDGRAKAVKQAQAILARGGDGVLRVGCPHRGHDARKPPPLPKRAQSAMTRLQALIVKRQVAAMRKVGGALRAQDAEPPPAIVKGSLDILKLLAQALEDLTPAERREFDEITVDMVMSALEQQGKLSPALSERPSTWNEQFRKDLPSLVTQVREQLETQYQEVNQGWIDEMAKTVAESHAQGESVSQLRERLLRDTDVAEGFAQRRAEQSIRTGIEIVARARQQSIGLEEYTWRTVGDSDVRPDHRARDGKRFRYDNPPPDGPPGTPWGCRCFAEPYFPPDWEEEQQDLRGPDFEHDRFSPAKDPPPLYASRLTSAAIEDLL